jgi:hypothetical protein
MPGKVIKMPHQAGLDMRDTYKETSKGGFTVMVVEC